MILFESTEEITIPGYGVMRLSQAKKIVSKDLEEALTHANKGSWRNVKFKMENTKIFCDALETYEKNVKKS